MNQFFIGDREIGDGQPVYIIVEAANCHEGDFETAKRMLLEIADTGVDAIKYQRHVVEDEMIPAHPKFETQRKRSLSLPQLQELKTMAEERGLDFICTPFSRQAADEVESLGVKAFKIGSGEATSHDYLEHVARKGIPTIFSRGMTSFDEVDEASAVFKKHGTAHMVLHCTSVYPASPEQLFLDSISVLKERLGVPVGYSSHIPSVSAAVNAAALGASLVEVHYSLDRESEGTTDHKVSLMPSEIQEMVSRIRELEKMRGVKEGILPEEEQVISWARHSVVSVAPIKKGEAISREQVSTKRPLWKGIPAKHLPEVLGKRATRDIEPHEQLSFDDFE